MDLSWPTKEVGDPFAATEANELKDKWNIAKPRKGNFGGNAAPTINDNTAAGYEAGSLWVAQGRIWVCMNPSHPASWKEITVQDAMLALFAAASGGGLVGFNNTASGLAATTVQAAIDALNTNVKRKLEIDQTQNIIPSTGEQVGTTDLVFPVLNELPQLDAFLQFTADGGVRNRTPVQAKVDMGLTDAGIVEAVNRALSGTEWQLGGSVTVGQFGENDWDVIATGVSGEVEFEIINEPSASAAITAYEYDTNGNNTWVALTPFAGPGKYKKTGFTNGVPVAFRLRAKTATATGLASTSKTVTPNIPAYVPVWVNNQGNAGYSYAAPGVNTQYLTIAMLVNLVATGAGGVLFYRSSGANNVSVTYNATTQAMIFSTKNASGVVNGTWSLKVTPGVPHCVVASAFYGATPVLQVARDGVTLPHTGDIQTGVNVSVPLLANSQVAWHGGSTGLLFTGAAAIPLSVAEFLVDGSFNYDPALFWENNGVKDWSGIGSAATRFVYLGHRMDLATWNSPTGAGNLGTKALTLANTFIAG